LGIKGDDINQEGEGVGFTLYGIGFIMGCDSQEE
jgi:hypothetical protein